MCHTPSCQLKVTFCNVITNYKQTPYITNKNFLIKADLSKGGENKTNQQFQNTFIFYAEQVFEVFLEIPHTYFSC